MNHSRIRFEIQAPTTPCVRLAGVGVHAFTADDCVRYIHSEIDAGRGGWLVTVNLEILRQFNRDRNMRAFIERSDLRVADGMPLVWASRLQGTPLPERVAGSDLISSLSAEAVRRRRSVFLLGGAPGSGQGTADVLMRRFAGLEIAGIHVPPFGFEDRPAECDELRTALLAADPDLVFVALGSPKSERLIHSHKNLLPQAWWVGVGISFGFLSGQVRRAPLWIQRSGFEWAHRLSQEPRRLARRYLAHGIPFATQLLIHAMASRFLRRARTGST